MQSFFEKNGSLKQWKVIMNFTFKKPRKISLIMLLSALLVTAANTKIHSYNRILLEQDIRTILVTTRPTTLNIGLFFLYCKLVSPPSTLSTINPITTTDTTKYTFEEDMADYQDILKKYFDNGKNKINNKQILEETDIPTGAILYGPPGNGKTVFAKALAQHGILVFEVANIRSMWHGQSEQRLTNIYNAAKTYIKKNKVPFVVVFLDEAESYLSERSTDTFANSINNSLVATFLRLTDGLDDESSKIVTTAATNHYNSLDSAAIRAGRLTRKIEVKKISHSQGRIILEKAFEKINRTQTLELEQFIKDKLDSIELSNAASWATIPKVANEYAKIEESNEITLAHFFEAVNTVEPNYNTTTEKVALDQLLTNINLIPTLK